MMITKEETIKKRLTSRFKGLGALMLALIMAVLPTPLLPAGHVEAAEGDNYYLIANIQSNVLLCSGQESIEGAKVYDEMTLSSSTNTNKYVEIPSGDNKLGLKEGSPLSIEGSFYYGNYEFQITVENDVTLYVGSVCESDPDADPPYNNLAFYSGASIQVKMNGTVVAENTGLYDEGKVSCQLPAGKYKVVNTPELVGDYLSYPRCKNIIDFETIDEGFVRDITGTEEVAAENNSFNTKIENSSDLETVLNLSGNEVADGVKVWLDVKDAGEAVPGEDKELVENAAGDNTVGMYLDINLFKKVGNNDAEKVTETTGKIRASILIPESLRKSGRTFEIIRVHDGKATVLPGKYDESTGIFTFETDRFSTYAIVYKESVASTGAVEASVSAESYKDPGCPLYRLYNKRTGEHFFTMSEVERNYWLDRSAETGWTDENIAWYVNPNSGIPVYRVFDAKRTGQHRFTADVNERDEYLKKGWVDEGIGWYSSGSEGKEIYKLKHPTAKNHYYHYTIYEEERDTLLAQGWTLEESGFTGQ